MPQNVVDILHGCKLFGKLTPHGFARLATMAVIRKFAKGRLIFRERDTCPGAYVVGSGLVRVFKTGSGGKEHVLHIVGPGGTFAEVAAIGGFRCPASAEAIAPTSAVLLPMDLLRNALSDDHELCLGMLTGMTFSVRRLVGQLEDVVLRDAAGRLARFLLESDRDHNQTVELPGLKRHVASHLNLTSETFSRILRRFVEAGLIQELDNHRMRLIDREKLAWVSRGVSPKI